MLIIDDLKYDWGKYLYCIIKEKNPKKFNFLGQEEKEVYTINQGDLAICVSDTSKEEYSFIKEHLTGHQKVIEQVMREGYDVLPVRFGTVAKSEEDIRKKNIKIKKKRTFRNVSNSGGKRRIRS